MNENDLYRRNHSHVVKCMSFKYPGGRLFVHLVLFSNQLLLQQIAQDAISNDKLSLTFSIRAAVSLHNALCRR